MDKTKALKMAGAGAATIMLFMLIQDMRKEINEIRERITRIETIQGVRDE